MGIKRWLARRGAVGGTARWAANGYKFFRQRHPDPKEFSDTNIFRLMVVTRYETMPNPEAEQFLLGFADGARGLRLLVVGILTVEAGFDENEESVQDMFMDIIEEELEKQGLPIEVINGGTV